jgi:hypothetical protein
LSWSKHHVSSEVAASVGLRANRSWFRAKELEMADLACSLRAKRVN